MRGWNVFHDWLAADDGLLNPRAFRRAIPTFRIFRHIAENLDELRIVHQTWKRIFHRSQISFIDRDQALLAVNEDLSVIQDGQLLPGDLKEAKNAYSHAVAEAGLTGEHSTHSLRYAWAQECLKTLERQGFDREEALALTSQYLGWNNWTRNAGWLVQDRPTAWPRASSRKDLKISRPVSQSMVFQPWYNGYGSHGIFISKK